jgi:hypothetical protein
MAKLLYTTTDIVCTVGCGLILALAVVLTVLVLL